MSTQIYDIGLFEANPKKKKLFSKEEIKEYCKHFNQHTSELNDFLELHSFEKWTCVGISIDAPYYRDTKDGRVDCSSPEFLGIMLTSMIDNKYLNLFKSYVKQDPVDGIHLFNQNEGIYDRESNVYIKEPNNFDIIDDCPLWVVQVKEYSQYTLSGIVIIPTEFWNEDDLNSESAGFGFLVKDQYEHWYKRDNGIDYRMSRIGGWSTNFLQATKTNLPTYHKYLYDSKLERLICYPDQYRGIKYYDIHSETLFELENFGAEGVYIGRDSYHFYTKKCLIKTNKEFIEIERCNAKTGLLGNKVLQEYEDKGWTVILTNNGIEITSYKRNIRDKLSTFKLKAGSSSSKQLLIYALDENHLVFLSDRLTVVDADINITTHSIKRKFNSIKLPNLGKTDIAIGIPNGVVNRKNAKPMLFSGDVVISFDENQNPLLMNQELYDLTGELCFYGAAADYALDGIWFLAGLGRIVFIENTFNNAYVFNIEGNGSFGRGRYHGSSRPFFHLDKAGNLRFALHLCNGIQKIERNELINKLKTAASYK